jgi:predicted nucleic-acid-binding protein
MSIAVDTNVIVRLLTRDDEQQFSVVQRLLRQARTQQQSVMVALLVVLETEWVLRSRYRKTKDMILQALTLLLESDDVTIEDEPTLEVTVSGEKSDLLFKCSAVNAWNRSC